MAVVGGPGAVPPIFISFHFIFCQCEKSHAHQQKHIKQNKIDCRRCRRSAEKGEKRGKKKKMKKKIWIVSFGLSAAQDVIKINFNILLIDSYVVWQNGKHTIYEAYVGTNCMVKHKWMYRVQPSKRKKEKRKELFKRRTKIPTETPMHANTPDSVSKPKIKIKMQKKRGKSACVSSGHVSLCQPQQCSFIGIKIIII